MFNELIISAPSHIVIPYPSLQGLFFIFIGFWIMGSLQLYFFYREKDDDHIIVDIIFSIGIGWAVIVISKDIGEKVAWAENNREDEE